MYFHMARYNSLIDTNLTLAYSSLKRDFIPHLLQILDIDETFDKQKEEPLKHKLETSPMKHSFLGT